MKDPVYLFPGLGFSSDIMTNVLGDKMFLGLDYFHLAPCSIDYIACKLARSIKKHSVIIAWSLGGLFAIKIASLFPDKIRKLVLLATQPRLTSADNYSGIDSKAIEDFISMATDDFETFQKRFIGLVGFPNKRIMKQLNACFRLNSVENLLACLKLILLSDLRDEYSKLKTSMLYIIGQQDAVLKQDAQCLLTLNPNAKIILIPNAGHSGFLTYPTLYRAIITNFIDR